MWLKRIGLILATVAKVIYLPHKLYVPCVLVVYKNHQYTSIHVYGNYH